MKNHTFITASAIAMILTAGLTGSAAAESAKNNTDMAPIPRGEFKMGSQEHADETQHKVVLDAYHIDKYEVSNKRYGEFMKATGHAAPAYWDDPRLNKPEQPVVGVNWYDAKAFCEFEGKRLPTEAEWERAAKGPDGSNHFPWGHTFDAKKVNYGQQIGRTSPVDAYPDGASGFGVYNMAGTVFEWVADWYTPDYYKNSPALNPEGPDKGYDYANQGPVKVLRGGSWLAPETSLHTSHRFWNQPENNSYGVGLGFRCAKSDGARTPGVKTAGEPVMNPRQEARGAYMQALVDMGVEKHAEAMTAIEKAIGLDPKNREYKDVRELIKKILDRKK